MISTCSRDALWHDFILSAAMDRAGHRIATGDLSRYQFLAPLAGLPGLAQCWGGVEFAQGRMLRVRPKQLDVGPRQDFRTFRVDRKVVEDAAQSVCSFYLVPEDGQPLPAFLPGQFLTFRLDVPVRRRETASRSSVAIRCRMRRAPITTVYRSSGCPPPWAAMFRRGVHRIIFMIGSRPAVFCRCVRRPGIFISTAAMPRWC